MLSVWNMGTTNLITFVHVLKISTCEKYCPTAAPLFHWLRYDV